MASSARSHRHPKKSAFSCEVCRKRKVKCDGEHPVCNRCRMRNDTCIYKLSPTLSYTQRLEQRVAELEASANSLPNPARDNAPTTDLFSPINQPRNPKTPRVGEDGEITFPESTSLFQLPGSSIRHVVDQNQSNQEMDRSKERLISSAWRERAFEQLADTPEPYRSLMDSHFCWIQPLFNFIYRPAFTRDMKTGGPYFSNALLNAVLAHSIRWCRGEPGMDELLAPFEDGAAFVKLATAELFTDIQHGNSKIPTVQALLLLSAQQCGSGNRTQAWLYSGMAFRLIDDMGICIDGQRYADAAHFSDEDIEVRNRLFWSCYFWDKLISLYFGRSPMIQNSEISPPRILMDDTAEIEPWKPHGLASSSYPPTQAHSISCFIQMCALAEILNQILTNLYNPSQTLPSSRAYQCATEQSSKLQLWWRELPDHLKINLSVPEPDCPPSHIVTLNCLYHTINILLNRAKLKLSHKSDLANAEAESNPLINCISSATSIVALFSLYSRTFGAGHVVLSLAYSVYTAASIFLLELHAMGSFVSNTLERLTFCVSVLESLKQTNPVIITGLNLIYKELDMLGIQIGLNTTSGTERSVQPSTVSQSSMPLPVDTFTGAAIDGANAHNPMSLRHTTEPLSLDLPYSQGLVEGTAAFNLLDMPSEMFDAFLQVEPLSVTMNPGFDIY